MVVTGETKNFSGRKSLTVSNTTIQYGGKATFTSARVVDLRPGFEAQAGSWTDIYIENIPPCDDPVFQPQRENIPLPVKSGTLNEFKSFELTFETSVSESSVSIFPNPTNSTVTIQLHSANPEAELNQIKLYDIFGREMLSQQIGGRSCIMDISLYQKGIYFIQVKDEANIYYNKIIIQ